MSEQDKCPKCGGTKVYAVPRTLTCTACKRSFDVDTSDQLAQAKARIADLEAENATLRAVLHDIIPFIEHNKAEIEPGHTCGPEGNCDCTCMWAAYDERLLLRVREAAEAAKEAPDA